MVLLGIGAGVAFNPLLLGAMSDASPEDSGLASGMMNTAFMMGGALGLAVLAALAENRAGGSTSPEALTNGYQAAFVAATIFAVVAATLCALLRTETPATQRKQEWASQSSTGS